MNIYTRLVAGVIFPLHERLKKHDTLAVRRSLEHSQWWSSSELRELQLSRLRALLRNAEREVPYYQELFKRSRFTSAQVEGLHDLCRVPLLSKMDIRANYERLRSCRGGAAVPYNTGGSTGEPLVFLLGNERVSHDVAAKWRATRWWGVDIGDREIVVWGSPIELGAQDRVRRTRDALMRSELLPAFQMSEARLDAYVERIRRFRPKMLFGYPTALAHIARHAERRRIALHHLGIRVAFATGEMLYESIRQDIERVFGCAVANGYGSREGGFIAHQCPAGGMHITAEDVIVETVDEKGLPVPPGHPGRIVVTHLATRQFPFIRYNTGDIGVLTTGSCPCGRGLPLIKEIHGRETDFVVAQDGTVMHGLALIYVIREIAGVRQFKIVQEDLARVRVLLVTEPNFRERDLAKMRAGLAARLGSGVEVVFDRRDSIPEERSGKYRYVVSHVAIREQVHPLPA